MSDEKLIEAMDTCDDEAVLTLVQEKASAGKDPTDILDDLTEGLRRLGERYAAGLAFIPELVFAGEIFTQAMAVLKPLLGDATTGRDSRTRVVIATVKGDLHDIGKSLVGTFLDLGGYAVIDLGHDVSNSDILAAVKEHRPAVVGLSALLTTTMFQQRDFISLLESHGLREQTKVIVGGAPATQAWADEIGADAFGADAVDGKNKIDHLLKA